MGRWSKRKFRHGTSNDVTDADNNKEEAMADDKTKTAQDRRRIDVRFSACPLWANSGHDAFIRPPYRPD